MKKLTLQAFAEQAAPTGVPAADAGQQAPQGDAPAAAQAQPDPVAGEGQADKTAAFEELIHGEYREEFARRVRQIIDRRFAREKRAQARTAAPQDAPAGESAPAPDAVDENARSAGRDRAYARLMQEAEALREVYPEMELAREAKDPAFVRMVRSGVPLRAAYEATHHQTLLRNAMQYTAAAVARQVSESIRSAAARPQENGSGGVAAQSRYNVQNMDRAQRRALIARAKAGEKIVL